jgi:peptidoglycan-associated lipoprotein
VFGFGTVSVTDRFHQIGHSGYFHAEFVRQYWRPYLLQGAVVPSQWEESRPVTPLVRTFLPKLPVQWLVFGLVVFLVLSAGRSLLEKTASTPLVSNASQLSNPPGPNRAIPPQKTSAAPISITASTDSGNNSLPAAPIDVPTSSTFNELEASFSSESKPTLTPYQQHTVTSLRRTIYFDFDSVDVKGEGTEVIALMAKVLKDNPGIVVEVGGYTDSRETDDAALTQGKGRAMAVKNALVAYGVRASRLFPIAYGSAFPAREGNDEEAWSKDRRVELRILRWDVKQTLISSGRRSEGGDP